MEHHRRHWYRAENKASQQLAEFYIYGVIGRWYSDGTDEVVTAAEFVRDLNNVPQSVRTIRVHVNSTGGDPHEATAIATALRHQKVVHGRAVEVCIDGLAASSATLVTSAGSRIQIADNALMFVHNPIAFVEGHARNMRDAAQQLDLIRDGMIATYQWVSHLSTEELVALLDANTWMSPSEAVANGFATEILQSSSEVEQPAAVTASFQAAAVLQLLGLVPERYRPTFDRLTAAAARIPAAAPPLAVQAPRETALAIFRLCAEDLRLAEVLISEGATLAVAEARVNAANEFRAAAALRARNIEELCARAQFPQLAAEYIKSPMPVDLIKAQLQTLTAAHDDAMHPDDQRRRSIDATAVYTQRNNSEGTR